MTRRDQPFFGDRGRCECGKVRWASRTDAKQFAKRHHPGDRVRAYRCGEFWHLGHTRATDGAAS